MTFSRSYAGAGAFSGALLASVCQPQARPMVMFVLPVGLMASILALSASQSSVSGSISVGQADAWCAGNRVLPATGAVV
jgi:hypothetical protein